VIALKTISCSNPHCWGASREGTASRSAPVGNEHERRANPSRTIDAASVKFARRSFRDRRDHLVEVL